MFFMVKFFVCLSISFSILETSQIKKMAEENKKVIQKNEQLKDEISTLKQKLLNSKNKNRQMIEGTSYVLLNANSLMYFLGHIQDFWKGRGGYKYRSINLLPIIVGN